MSRFPQTLLLAQRVAAQTRPTGKRDNCGKQEVTEKKPPAPGLKAISGGVPATRGGACSQRESRRGASPRAKGVEDGARG